MRIGLPLSFVLLCGFTVSIDAQSQAPPHRTAHTVSRGAAAGAGERGDRYKGIFEPVNYGQDVKLTDVFFVSPDVGWVAGEHATILKTIDGGAHWAAEVGGDPNGNEKPIGQLRFLDARHGWAVTDDQRLLRTMDGENWEQIGQQPAPGSGFVDYAFTSVRHGIALGGNMGGFYVTDDGGRHWRNVGPCRISVTIQGLAQAQDCWFLKLEMLTANSGLAFTHWRSPEAPNATSLAIFRTDNGGQSWTYVVPAFHDGGDLDIFFTDLNHGVAVFDSRTYITSDGGRNWRALLSGGAQTQSSRVRFADPQIGWSVGNKYPSLALSYTTDGGQHWKTVEPLRLPGDPNGKELSLSFPRRDRAYIVGPHGMICRYRVVSADYAAANAFVGPLMPGFGGEELSAKAAAIRRDITALQNKLAALLGVSQSPAVSGPGGHVPNSVAGSSPGSSSSAADQPVGSDTGQGAASGVAAGTTAGFTQQNVSATADAIASNSNTPTFEGFTQDTSSPSDALATCCAAAVQQLQTDTSGFVSQIPQVTSQLRPLNLIVAGLQLAATLMNQGQGLWQQFKTLKHAPNAQTAIAALQQLSTTLATVEQASSSGLQNPGAWFAQNAPAAFTQDVGNTAAGTGAAGAAVPGTTQPQSGVTPQSAVPQSGTRTQSSNTPNQQNAAANIDQTVDKAKQKIKSKLKWPQL